MGMTKAQKRDHKAALKAKRNRLVNNPPKDFIPDHVRQAAKDMGVEDILKRMEQGR